MKKEIKTIEIIWEGPISKKEFESENKLNNEKIDYGIYQIYGMHPISGPDTLLYIGKADQDVFSVRLNDHFSRSDFDFAETKIYAGRISKESLGSPEFNEDKKLDDEWSCLIDKIEKILIYFCSPPYNTQCLSNHAVKEEIIILNYHNIARLPYTISNLWTGKKINTPHENILEWKIK